MTGAHGVPGTAGDVVVQRAVAFVVDHVLSIVLAVVLGAALVVTTGSRVLVFVGVAATWLGYFVGFEAIWGQTPGKWFLGIAVVNLDDYGPITPKQAVIRNVLRVVDGFASYAVGLVVMLTNDERMRIGDHAALTTVVEAEG